LEATICYLPLHAELLSLGSEFTRPCYPDLRSCPHSGFFNKATEDAVFSNVIDLLFNCTAFIYIGAIIPFDSFNDSALHVSAQSWIRILR
jgi:hypothetical protein